MKLWGRRDVTGGVRALLEQHPQLPEYAWRPTFTADELRKVAKAMSQKAAGPDGWSTASWCLLPDGFFAALAQLWGTVVSSGVTPDLWRLGRVVLLAKPSGGHRPLTILPVPGVLAAACWSSSLRAGLIAGLPTAPWAASAGGELETAFFGSWTLWTSRAFTCRRT